MDVVSLGFLILIVAIGAVIALIADNLGRTLGKKRLKFLHLRPRHTAMLFTALAGLAIPLITVLLVATVSSDVRQWILEGRKAIADVKKLEAQRTQLQQDVREKTELAEKAEANLRESERRVNETKKQNTALERRLPQLQGQVQTAQARLQGAQARISATRKSLDATIRNLRVSENSLVKSRTEERLTQSNFAAAAAQLRDAQTELISVSRELENSDRELTRLKTLIETSRTEFQKEREESERELGQLRRDLASTRQQIDDTQDELRNLQLSVSALQGVNESSRTKGMIYALGNEVARIVVPPNQPNSGARNQLARLLRTARLAAEARGAKGSPAAGLFGQERTPEEEAAAIIATIGGLPDSRVLIAYARVNTFAGEPVALRVEMRPYKLAFAADEIVSEVRIDGDSKPSEVLQALSAWLAGPLRDQALTRGMVPIEGADAPLGTVDPGTLLNLVFEILAQNRTARVQALAEEQTFTGDELKLRFRIR